MTMPTNDVDVSPSTPPSSTTPSGANPAGLHPLMESSPVHSIDPPIAEVEMIGDSAVATLLASELALQAGVEQLAELLLRLEETGARNFVLDTQNVQYMDSACLGCLVQSMNRLAQSGGRIALANTNRNVQYLFRMTQLDRVFVICSDVISAIESFQPKVE